MSSVRSAAPAALQPRNGSESAPGSNRVSAEQLLRSAVKAELSRFVRGSLPAVVVEEMEVCAGRARIDVALITDTLTGIEIKSADDTVARLPGQVQAYSQCFDRVVLVIDEALAPKAKPMLPDWWGLVVSGLGGDPVAYEFQRRPRRNPQLNLESLLALLWKDEAASLLAELLAVTVSQRVTKKVIRAKLLEHLPPAVLRSAGVRKLRERTAWRSVPLIAA